MDQVSQTTKPQRTGKAILALLTKKQEQLSTSEIATELNLPVEKIYAALNRLWLRGEILKTAPQQNREVKWNVIDNVVLRML